MKIVFVLPGVGKKPGEKYIKSWKMEPLCISTLKALTPAGVETEFFDDRLELVDYGTGADLAAITVETYTAARAYKMAAEFRKRGVKVILGGYHVTLLPGEAAPHADSILTGNAENVWSAVIEDFKRGELKQVYEGGCAKPAVQPDRSIYTDKKYLPLNLVETGRGCPFACEFCAISSYYGSRYLARDPAHIVSELEAAPHKFTFLVDDNIAADPRHAGKLFEAIAPLKTRWFSQASLHAARDRSLLKKMKKSGCEALLIGFESLDEANLKQMKKGWSCGAGEAGELVRAIHGEGISIYATFVFGFDNDTPDTFKQALDFSQEHGFFFTAFNHLLPFPGTPLYDRLRRENRLTKEAWWLESDYSYGDIPYTPSNMSPRELSQRCAAARREFFKYSSILRRGGSLLGRNADPLLAAIFLSQNLELRAEVDGKLELPVGRGLDELPK
ncbi:MAG: radical SAM protein [Elusimicrobiota bacterium]|nr:radical SAM protein [Elusimicrobiota bacterium]